MIVQIGKNPEFTFSASFITRWHSGALALPVRLSWWNYDDAENNRNIDIAITILCFHFDLDIWFWNKGDKL